MADMLCRDPGGITSLASIVLVGAIGFIFGMLFIGYAMRDKR